MIQRPVASADTTALIEEARRLTPDMWGQWSDAPHIIARLTDALETEHKMRRDYENAITWDTNCLNCSKLLDRCYEDHVRAEKAEAELRRPTSTARGVAPMTEDARYWLRLTWHTLCWYHGVGRLRALFNAIVRHHNGEQCLDCGRPYILWWADDKLYHRLIGNGNGMYCPNCFDRRARRAGITLRWKPQEL